MKKRVHIKTFVLCILLAVLMSLAPIGIALAEPEPTTSPLTTTSPDVSPSPSPDSTSGETPQSTALVPSPAPLDESLITCHAAMLVDQDTGKVLYAKNAQDQLAPASTTKVMTAVLLLEEGPSLDTVVEIGSDIAGASGSSMGLVAGDRVTLEDLLYGMFLKSGNDSALAVAKAFSGSVDAFVQRMNEKAQELGMTHTHFANPHGRDNEEHLSTVEDMARLARYASKFPVLYEIASTKTHTIHEQDGNRDYLLENTNKLVYSGPDAKGDANFEYQYATGLKTGSTPNAGGCLIATASKDGQNLIALVYGDQSEEGAQRWSIATTLLDYGFENYQNTSLAALLGNKEVSVTVAGASEDGADGPVVCQPVVEEDGMITVSRALDPSQITVDVQPREGITLPIEAGDVLGTAEYKLGDDVLFSGNIAAAENVSLPGQSPVTTLEPVEIEEPSGPPIDSSLLWIWLVIPLAIIAFIIIRAILVNRRRRRYSRRYNRRRPTHYRYKPRRHRRY